MHWKVANVDIWIHQDKNAPTPKGSCPYLNSSAPHIHMQPRQWVVLGNEAKPMLHRVYTGHERYYRSHYNQWCCLHWMLRGATNLRQKTAAKFYLFEFELFEVMCGRGINLCSAFNPSKCTHTQQWTHTHPEQWAANAAAPGEQLGVRSRVSPQSWYWRWREHLLFTPPHWQFLLARDSNPQPRVTSPMLHPFGHDCLYGVLTQILKDFQRSLYRVQCRQTSGVDTVLLTYREEPKQPRCTIAGLPLLESSPVLESSSDIYTGPTSCLIVPQTFSSCFFIHHLYLSVTRLSCSLNALSSTSWVDTPLTADWLQVCFGTRPYFL